MTKRKPRKPSAVETLQLAVLDRYIGAQERMHQQTKDGGRTADSPTNDEQGKSFLHCGKCLLEVQKLARQEGSASPRDYARLSVAWTPVGLQVWCVRHDVNVLHVDFEGFIHPGNTTRKGTS